MPPADSLSAPRPFRVSIPEDQVYRMQRLVEDTRLPDEPTVENASWNYGVDLAWLKDMRNQWIHDFDWKKVEQEMNRFQHFKATIEAVDVHFVHHRSNRDDAIPLIMLHGWPGSFWEFHKTVDMLTNPSADQPAFHVVIPSLPGFGFSSAPPKQDWAMEDNARILDILMTGVLGYKSYMAEGGDFGALVCLHLGSNAYPACKLLDICAVPSRPTLGAMLTLPFFLLPTSWRQWLYARLYTETERKDFERIGRWIKHGLGYFVEQATRPMTIGYALYDSPVGLLAWIGEKYKEHVDPEIFPECSHFILTTVAMYYLTGTFPASTLPYRDNSKTFGEVLTPSHTAHPNFPTTSTTSLIPGYKPSIATWSSSGDIPEAAISLA